MDTDRNHGGVLLIVGAASLFGWVLTTTRVTEYTTEALLALTDNRYVILLLTNVLLLVIGCFLEPIASISILVPVLMPVIVKVGIDPVHFGVMMTLNLMIGLLHPPLGMVLFVLSRVAKLSIERTTMAILPWLIPSVIVADSNYDDPGADLVAAQGCRDDQIEGELMSATALTRRTILAGMAATPFARTAGAQAAWPNRPVRVIVPIRRPAAPIPRRASSSASSVKCSASNSS